MDKIQINTRNIPHQYQAELLTKLKLASSSLFYDEKVIKLINQEIKKRKDNKSWLHLDDVYQLDNNAATDAGDTS